jgi:hypothetical protein
MLGVLGMYKRSCASPCREELFDGMMKERDDVVAKRTACQAVLAALRQALAELDCLPADLEHTIEAAGLMPTAPRQGAV